MHPNSECFWLAHAKMLVEYFQSLPLIHQPIYRWQLQAASVMILWFEEKGKEQYSGNISM
jgi:hypothetical protein